MKNHLIVLFFAFSYFTIISATNKIGNFSYKKPIKILLLTGSNNHDWRSTTSFLENMFSENGLYIVDITGKPDTLKSSDLRNFDAIVSNWNSWPENDIRWPASVETALLNFISEGGGFVTFHASSSAFYKWSEFKRISTAAWITDRTWHGKNSATCIEVTNLLHPVTRDMSGFYIFDELWVQAEQNAKFEVLGSATNEELIGKDFGNQPAISIGRFGKGRIFHTILGHDVRTMRNIGFQTLLLRGTEWAATGKVTQVLPQELQENRSVGQEMFAWQKTDSTFSLLKGEQVVWQYNYNTKHGRPFFHPIYVENNKITCVSPDDHPWHLGQWFCWKYINKVNYWEYINGTYSSEGVTDILNVELKTNPDYSAEIELEIAYRPMKGKRILSEIRTIKVSPPSENGNIWMDYNFIFKAIADSVLLDRTPIDGEPHGQSWGGYAGLSIRFNQDFMDSHFITSWQNDENINGNTGDWLYMGFKGLDGKQVGSQIMIDPTTERDGAAWYSVNTNDLPFYYFSPAFLYKKPLVLLKDEKINLRYRILHLNGEMNYFILKEEFNKFHKEYNQ